MYNAESFINYLGVDYDKKGGLCRIVCPFHDDTHPSLVVYPELERGCCCFACGETCSWAHLAHVIKGIPYKQALDDLGQESLPPSERRNDDFVRPPKLNFCEQPKWVKQFTEKHAQCMTIEQALDKMDDDPAIYDFIMWLVEKCLDQVAMELDWRWHDGTVFKRWGKGVVIPYKVGNEVMYERFREWDAEKHKFEKPKGPADVGIQPYYSCFRPNNTVFIAEGESDCASLFAHGCSALGVPGAHSKKSVNSVVAFIADRPYITTVVACGDKDHAGQCMNENISEAMYRMAPKCKLITYEVESKKEKADINDDHVEGLLKVPVEWTANCGENYNRQPWADKDFADFCDNFDDDYVPCAELTTEGWLKGSVLYKKKDTTVYLDGSKWKKVSPADVSQSDKPLMQN